MPRGRPRIQVDMVRASKLIDRGLSENKTAAKLGVAPGTLRARLKEMAGAELAGKAKANGNVER